MVEMVGGQNVHQIYIAERFSYPFSAILTSNPLTQFVSDMTVGLVDLKAVVQTRKCNHQSPSK